MEKVIRDGKVAVLISRGYGAGWYTWTGVQELIFDPAIVSMLENGADGDDIEKYCSETYGEDNYYGGIDGLTIVWVPVGKKFIVEEYDGAESIKFLDVQDWIIA